MATDKEALKQELTDIADAIRSQTGSTEQIPLTSMASMVGLASVENQNAEWNALISLAPKVLESEESIQYYRDLLVGKVELILPLSDHTWLPFTIIGVGEDTKTDGSKVAFTLMATMSPKPRAIDDTGKQVRWSKSSLRTYLNGDFLSMLPQNVRDAIVPVKRTVRYYTNNTQLKNDVTDDYVWILSLEQMTSSNSLAGASYSPLNIDDDSLYTYWAARDSKESRLIMNIDGNLINMWTRSCAKRGPDHYGFYTTNYVLINTSGYFTVYTNPEYTNGTNGSNSYNYLPCFCIG